MYRTVTKLEVGFSLVIVFIGVSLYATVIGNVGSLLSNLDSTSVCNQLTPQRERLLTF